MVLTALPPPPPTPTTAILALHGGPWSSVKNVESLILPPFDLGKLSLLPLLII
jgi:hypothetical protein